MTEELKAHAFPAKNFFVSMLTRDIDLSGALLDLLDNCIDGVVRTKNRKASFNITDEKPYEGFWAEIEFDEKHFSIGDNCGGIPLDVAQRYAFMMGRANDRDESLPTVGVYGIGMKRALFKMGLQSRVMSHTPESTFTVDITEDWLKSDTHWDLDIHQYVPPVGQEYGTFISITNLYESVAREFSGNTGFPADFAEEVAQQYSFIIQKGFNVKVNGVDIKPVPLNLYLDNSGESGFTPYVFKDQINGVRVLLEVGFHRGIPDENEIDDEQKMSRSSDEAGWTIICNDRVVVYKDKSIKTGWGEAGVPKYHNQFIMISGVVFFQSNDASKLPLVTTKRGIDGSSELYLTIKNYMRDGLKIFTNYTSKWKSNVERERVMRSQAVLISVQKVPEAINDWKTVETPFGSSAQRHIPKLPEPPKDNPIRQIRFNRDVSEIRRVAVHLFEDPSKSAGEVGNACFEEVLRGISE